MYKRLLLMVLVAALAGTISAQKIVFQGLKEINGTQLYVKVIGKGEPLFVVHGGPGLNHQYFLPHLNALAKKYQLVFYDQRGTGASQLEVKANMNIKTFVEDIEALRDSLGYDKISLLAHSWGAIPVAAYMAKYPEHVQAVIFCNPVPMNSFDNHFINEAALAKQTPADSARRAAIMQSAGFQKGDVATIDTLMRMSFKYSFCDTAKMAMLDMHLPENYMVSSLSLYGLAADMKQYNYLPMLHQSTIPTLIIHGSCDLTPMSLDNALQLDMPSSKLVVFEHSGHFPFIEENQLFTKTVYDFLDGTYKK